MSILEIKEVGVAFYTLLIRLEVFHAELKICG